MSFRHLDALIAEVAPIAERFSAAGHRLYLVGGIVRDQWLDRELDSVSDIDLTTDAAPATIKKLVAEGADALWTQGERFGTIGVHVGGRALEITTHRAESYTPESRKPEVSFGTDVAVDLSRRDFTVNAMAIEVPGGELSDPWGGAEDLATHRLRTPLAPEVSFRDDPLRMLRAARFAAKYDLEPTDELRRAAHALRDRLGIVAIERIGDEVARLFALPQAATGVDFLIGTGLLQILLAWDAEETVFDEQALLAARDVVDAATLRDAELEWQVRFAALLLRVVGSARAVDDAARRLRLSKDDRTTVVKLAEAAAAVLERPALAPELRRWSAVTARPADAIRVARAIGPAETVDAFEAARDTLLAAEPPALASMLGGASIMRLLGLEPGPIVGEAVEVLRQALFDQGPLPAAAQEELLTEWWADHGART